MDKPTAEERFWAKIEKTPTCWNWIAYIRPDGYGAFTVNRKNTPPHRYSWELLRGPIPKGLQIDHLCRNRRCVNPDHLEPVTPLENSRRGELGGPPGARNGHAKLTDEKVRELRAIYKGMKGHRVPNAGAILKKYDISGATLSLVVNGKRWKHVL